MRILSGPSTFAVDYTSRLSHSLFVHSYSYCLYISANVHKISLEMTVKNISIIATRPYYSAIVEIRIEVKSLNWC